MSKVLMSNYAPLDIVFERGAGAYLYDNENNAYLDALAGIAVCSLGHAHPAITAALSEQAGCLIHTSNIYQIAQQKKLAEKLTQLAAMESSFFCNSGAEANEAAIKIARLHGHSHKIDTPVIVVMEGAFHGRTMATLTATANRKAHAGFEPLVQGFIRVPFNDIESLKNIARQRNDIAAVLVEPVQGEGGINIPATDYLENVREICDSNNWLMMLDEIQTGMGRTGKWFGFQHGSFIPDVMTLAKALGNGVPIGAVLASGTAATLFQPGSHGSTYGGNPLACAAALAVIETLQADNLIKRSAELGARMLRAFTERLLDLEQCVDIRGIGMMFAIQMNQDCPELVQKALDEKLLINVTAGSVIRLLPPLIISDTEADDIVDGVCNLIEYWVADNPHRGEKSGS